MNCAKRSFGKLTFTARQHVQHRLNPVEILTGCDAGCDVFAGAGSTGIYCIDVQFKQIFDISRHNRSGEPLNVFEGIAQSRKVEKIFQRATSIDSFSHIQNGDRCTTSTKIKQTTSCLKVQLGHPAVNNKFS